MIRLFRCVAALLALACAFAATGCTTSQSLGQTQAASMTKIVKPGDTVECTLRDGSEFKFKVVSVEADTLVGSEHRVPVKDVMYLRIKRFSAAKTLLLVAGFALAGVAGESVAEMGALGFPTPP